MHKRINTYPRAEPSANMGKKNPYVQLKKIKYHLAASPLYWSNQQQAL